MLNKLVFTEYFTTYYCSGFIILKYELLKTLWIEENTVSYLWNYKFVICKIKVSVN